MTDLKKGKKWKCWKNEVGKWKFKETKKNIVNSKIKQTPNKFDSLCLVLKKKIKWNSGWKFAVVMQLIYIYITSFIKNTQNNLIV